MADIRVTLSANAGISVQVNKNRIWVDALHNEKQPGFSAVTPGLYQRVMKSEAFVAPDYICVTHCHPDHYAKELVEEAKKRWPAAKLCLPEQEAHKIRNGELSLEFIRLPHEGAQYANVLHYGILIGIGQKNILIAGDCETASSALEQAIGERRIDLAVLNFPWATLSKGRTYLIRKLKPKHILLCHLPFAEDDVGGFRTSAQRNARLLADEMDLRLLSEPLQTEIVNI